MPILRKIYRKLTGRNPDAENLKYLLENGMTLGKNSYINSGCSIDTGWPWLIAIGDNVNIASNVTILAHDASTNIVGCGSKLGRVTIGNNVFIGTRSVILCNVRIGNNVIVGAGSIVTKDLEDNGVYAGSPAKKICDIDEYRKRMTNQFNTRPHFDSIRRWDDWKNATDAEKKKMKDDLNDGPGFV